MVSTRKNRSSSSSLSRHLGGQLRGHRATHVRPTPLAMDETDAQGSGMPTSRLHDDIPEQGSHQQEPVVNDGNQYEKFYEEEYEFPTGRYFPVSELSTEANTFNENLAKILAWLRRKNVAWKSVECVGRLSQEQKIRTTVLIGLSDVPDAATQERYRTGIRDVMGQPQFPIEFAKGGFVKKSKIGIKELQQPLVCGGSCGAPAKRGSGTIGGFVTIQGDLNKDAIYAMTCHHVVSKASSGIPWTTGTNFADCLGLSGRSRRLITDKGGDECLTPFNRNYLQRILCIRDELKSSVKPLFHDDIAQGSDLKTQEAYVGQVIAQVLRLSPTTPTTQRMDDLKDMKSFILSKIRPDFGSERNSHDLDKLISKKFNKFVAKKFMGVPINISADLREIREECKRVLSIRRLCRELADRLVEHPSASDRRALVRRLDAEMRKPRNCRDDQSSSGERWEARESWEAATTTSAQRRKQDNGIDQLQLKRTSVLSHSQACDRFIGVVWASQCGITQRPKIGRVDPVQDFADWALIRLFPEVQSQIRSEFDKNILWPQQRPERFTTPKIWPLLTRYQVSKRGRTTDYTIGQTNGTKSVVRAQNWRPTIEYCIVGTGTNGRFAQAGDSGSWVMDKTGKLVGMVKGEHVASGNTIYTPAQYLFRRIRETFEAATLSGELEDRVQIA